MKLWEYAIIFDGVRDKETNDWKEKPELLQQDNTLAETEQQAQIIAARAIPEKFVERLDSVTIAVRPF